MYVLELGGEDDRFAAREAANATTDVRVVATGLATATAIDPTRLRGLAYTHAACELVGTTAAEIDRARAHVAAMDLDRSGSVAVRARDVRGTTGIDTQVVERSLGAALVERGFGVDLTDPDHELRALFSDDRCFLGWTAAESVRDYGARKPTDRPFFQPGSMDPMVARAIANLAGAGPGSTVLDPMCGTGGLLIEAGLVGAEVIGADVQARMVVGARENAAAYLPSDRWTFLRADAASLPVRSDGVDAIVFDAPYGRQSKVASADADTLLAGALRETYRVASRAVVVTDRPREDPATAAGWRVADRFTRRVHRSLTRHIAVLER